MNINGYNLIVKWSDEDECFVGTCPELFSGGCHGEDESSTSAELEVIVEDVLADFKKEGRAAPLPSTRTARTSSALAARVCSKLNQEQFAQAIGVPVGTVRNWEQKRSSPKGAARTLLSLIEVKPETIHVLRKLPQKKAP
jgi:DNA-binding transcriptional regulator YiaG